MAANRRAFLKSAGMGTLGASLACDTASDGSRPDARPNIIFIFSDQQRWDTVDCYRDTPILADPSSSFEITPNLNRMAAEGVRFQNAFTCQPVCGPARACLQTGRYASEVGCQTNNRRLPPDATTMAHRLSAGGYEVGYIGKWHLASCGERGGPDDFKTKPVPPDRRGGYDDFWLASDVLEFTSHSYDGHMFDAGMNRRDFPPGRYRVDAQTDWVLEYLESRTLERPFFLFLSYIEPHHQNDHNHYEGPEGSEELFGNFAVPGDLLDTEGDWRAEYPDYLGCIHSLDKNLGRIRDTLSKLGIADNTLLLYTSDHGSHFRTRNAEYKRSCHDGCIHIPMLACGPGFEGGTVVRDLVSLIDIPPTILAGAGLDIPADFRGTPLQPVARGDTSDRPDDVFLQISESHCGRALRTHRWKYSVRALDAGPSDAFAERYAEDFLYDLDADPYERNNLVADPAYGQVREEMKERLLRRMASGGEPACTILPNSLTDDS